MCFDVYRHVKWLTALLLGRPASLFIDEGEENVTQRDKREKSQGAEGFKDRRAFFSAVTRAFPSPIKGEAVRPMMGGADPDKSMTQAHG